MILHTIGTQEETQKSRSIRCYLIPEHSYMKSAKPIVLVHIGGGKMHGAALVADQNLYSSRSEKEQGF
ncbi:hypothetical protein AD935_09005 [Gluconobacter japonicus]|nr:hypothetical protein AD935_09005 [Gluconobacter japonicus]